MGYGFCTPSGLHLLNTTPVAGLLECTLVGSLSGPLLFGIEFGSRFPSLRDDHFPRFRRWWSTLTMFKNIHTSTTSRAHQNGSTCVAIHGHVFAFDSTRLVHVQARRSAKLLAAIGQQENLHLHACLPHHAHQHLHRFDICHHLDRHAIINIITTRFEIHPLPQDRPNGASGPTSSRSVFEIIFHAIRWRTCTGASTSLYHHHLHPDLMDRVNHGNTA